MQVSELSYVGHTWVAERYMWRALDDVTADPYIANEDSLCPGVSWPYFATSVQNNQRMDCSRLWHKQKRSSHMFWLRSRHDMKYCNWTAACFPKKLSRFSLQLDFMTEAPDIRLTSLHSCKDTFKKPQLTPGRVRQALTNKITECQRVRGGNVCQSCRLIWAEYLRMQTTLCVPRSMKKQSRSSDRGQSVPSRRLPWPQTPVFSVTLGCRS